MTDINSDFETATLPDDLARCQYVSTEDNLAYEFYRPGIALINKVRGILGAVDWDNFDPSSAEAQKAFPVLVAAANATGDGREVLTRGIGLSQEEISVYSKSGAVPDSWGRLSQISLVARPYAIKMIDGLEASFKRVEHYDMIMN